VAALSQEVLAAMNLKHLSHNVSRLLRQRNFAALICGALMLSNVFLSLKVMNQDDHWVIIPWPETDRRLPLSRHNLTDRYLIDWADGLTSRLLTMNPQTADQRMYEFLLVTESSGGLEAKLKKQVDALKSENLSTAFYPRDYAVKKDARQVWVTGDFHTFFGKDKSPVIQKRTVVLTYRTSARGCILVKDFFYEGDHD
jgi:type IV conjugative transfer system protein TraE